ncbi:hypothetical protein [Maribacter sp. 2308TA10-17]|uniref:hypothetical protein n=1 Tax=Maribacter sp. 2308TA10-17 TaxID=3386276 RepID=UPI0039BC4E21
MKKLFLVPLFCIAGLMGYSQNNLIDDSSWTEGNGSATRFTRYGTDANSLREFGPGPAGENALLWKAIPNTAAGANADGGWTGNYKTIDPTKTYRLSVWAKKTNSNDGRVLLGMIVKDAGSVNSALRLNGNAINSPYFINGDLPNLDQWYLLVGVIHGSGHTGTAIESAVYDRQGNAVSGLNVNDFKFAPSATRIRERVFLNLDNTAEDNLFFYAPTLYEVNGQEPPIEDLLGSSTVWNIQGNDVFYNLGNVGIGTDSPDEALTVDGKIHTREVRVDIQAPFVPDYVFYDDYNLKTLEEVQNFIDAYGHLPNIPSAKEMEKEGMNLKEMNLKLLEKVEELTLYILQLQENQKQLTNKLKQIENQN